MSKFEPLWKYLKENNQESYKMSYEEIKREYRKSCVNKKTFRYDKIRKGRF